jgi:transposase
MRRPHSGTRHGELFILRADGTTEIPKRLAMTPAAFKKFFSREPAKVALENGTHSRWVSALLTKLGHDVAVANTRRLALITSSDSKSDRTDSELLARLARADLSLLSPIKHRGRQPRPTLQWRRREMRSCAAGRSWSIRSAAW